MQHTPQCNYPVKAGTALSKMLRGLLIAIGACVLIPASPLYAAGGPLAGIPAGDGSYEDLVSLFAEFRAWSSPEPGTTAQAIYPDYSSTAVAARVATLQTLQARLADMAVAEWPQHQQVDYLAVRSRFDKHEFLLRVSRPWARDPGFYVDQMLRITFTGLPLPAPETDALRVRLQAIAGLVRQAQVNLTDVAADYADLALFNLSNADGVGHGYPYRATPPQGVIGWYADLVSRATKLQPDLTADIAQAGEAVQTFADWLVENRTDMRAAAGVGKAHFDWYLKHVKLMPYNTDQIVTLGERELDRLWSVYALEQHRNRALPPIALPKSADEYAQRLASSDAQIRRFLEEQDIITIPGDIGELDTNVPWIKRPGGPNFWEQVQYRNPVPDHLHAVIPGHRFDGVLARRSTHPIRQHITSGARAEGWATYLEEGMMNAGLLDEMPRVRELIYLFGIFRAARVPADVWLQQNQMTVQEVLEWWMARVPLLDENVARVDAEIYLRRPPGYGLGYTIGMLQMQKMLGDRKRQLRERFVLKRFHDDFMAAGRLPMSLIRWEITGLDDEVRDFWDRQPMPLR